MSSKTMKKTGFVLIATLIGTLAFAASYTDNTYAKLAREYTARAERAFDAGEYDKAVEYSNKAEENAELSQGYINMMLARSDAQTQIKQAENRITWAAGIKADRNFPMAFTAAQTALDNAKKAFDAEDYAGASSYAKQVMDALADVKEITPLPQFYTVRPWATDKDCYWNISGRPYVYNNPLLWENLYQANKKAMPDPANPNLIRPGMKMEIPSITGEYREGEYNPSKQYDPYNAKK